MDKDKTEDQTQESEELEQSASEEAATQEETQEQESQEEEQETESSEAEETTEEETEEEEPEPSPRQNKAIERLTKKLAEANQREETPQLSQKEQQLIKDGEYDTDELNALLSKHGNDQYQAGLSQANALAFETRMEIDTPRVTQKYPILDPNSDNFDPGITDYVNRQYLSLVGYDPKTRTVSRPNIRYEEYADATMAMIDTVVASRGADSAKNVARQAARTGVRPNSVAKKSYQGSDPRKMTDDQLTSIINEGLGIKPR